VKTSTSGDGKEYFSHIKITKIEDGSQTPPASTPAPASAPQPQQQVGQQAESSLNLRDMWMDICLEILAEKPHNETEIATKVIKNKITDEKIHEMLDNPSIRKQLADVRKTMLTAFVGESFLKVDSDGKYQLAV
jgi:hypothetical protein